MTDNALRRLQQLLSELFQLEHADLDFGIYRLFRLKRNELKAFIEEQLPGSVDEAFGAAAAEERAAAAEELANLEQELREEFGRDDIFAPDGALLDELRKAPGRTVQELIAAYDQARAAVQGMAESEAHRVEVFNHLHAFFSRYYDDGDFVPHRRYGAHEHYAVPYNGEETYFHWANRGQHYVKSAEMLRDYAFTVEGDLVTAPRRVRFVLAAASVPPGDTKGDARYFFPRPDDVAWDPDSATLTIPFEYRRPTAAEAETYGRTKQEGILADTIDALHAAVPEEADLRAALARPISEEEGAPSLLLRHLRRFVRRSTSDYFVHRDLRGFLTRELEFYVKDQILHVADLDGDLPARTRTIRIFRQVATDVIEFLAQIEDVQKRLFEKRKFVLRTDYLVLLKEIPQEMWGEIVANERQLAAWEDLFKVPRTDALTDSGEPRFDSLAKRPTLVVDTSLFDEDFRDRILECFDDLDDAIGGVVIRSENYQALRLIQPKYAGRIKCIYIDPPYNTGSDDFVYKDRFQHSSWLTMMEERLPLALSALTREGSLFVSIDDSEGRNLWHLAAQVAGRYVGSFVWKRRSSSGLRSDPISVDHEYVLLFGKPGGSPVLNGLSKGMEGYPFEDERGRYASTDLTVGMTRSQRPRQFYTITNPRTGVEYPANPDRVWRFFPETMAKVIAEDLVIWPDEVPGTSMTRPRFKTYFDPESAAHPVSSWIETTSVNDREVEDDASEWALQILCSGMNQEGGRVVAEIFGSKLGSYPKPVSLVRSFVRAATDGGDWVLDHFAGSGTTGHAVLDLWREDGKRRSFILVEQAVQFDELLLPRIEKLLYADSWKKGEPIRPANPERTPAAVKVVRLESYEDALHNLSSGETQAREALRVELHRKRLGDDAYRLRYLARLPLEASASMLSLEKLEHPFEYTLETLTEEGPVERRVDLVETFNLAAGLHVERLTWWTNEADDRRRYRVVRARDRDERRVLVLWRDMDGLDAAVERAFLDERLAALDPRPDRILINGDSGHPDVESLDPLFKRLIEEEERP